MTLPTPVLELWQYTTEHWRALLGWVWFLAGVHLAIHVTLQRRSPAATLAWILGLCLISPLGLIVYRFFGPQKVKRQSLRRLRSQARLRAHCDMRQLLQDRPQPPVWAFRHSQMIEASCGIPPSHCDAIEVINGGGAALQAIVQQIGQARCHVHLEYYIFEPDQSGQQLMDALLAALQRGVKVRLLVDDVGSARFMGRAGKALRERFLAAGGQLAAFHPSHFNLFLRPMLNLRTHRKIVVCDGWVGFTGGINITDDENEHLRPQTAYRDTHLRLEGAAVRWLQYVFLENWAYASGEHKFEPGVWATDRAGTGRHLVQVAASGPDSSGQAIHHSVLHAIGMAQQRVWLTTPYFVPTEPAEYALLNAALRGVEVKILVPRRSDSFWVTMAARSYFKELRDAGAQVYEYTGPMLHAKTLVVDDNYSMVGTANFDNRSFLLNFEVCVVLYSTELTRQIAQMFTEDLRQAQRVTAEPGKQPWHNALLESIARLFSPLL
ncbi:MAG: cardiolipin synthase [Brachymonas sp.]|nr:cardiolipin synthase [Brachymonas sp.]